MAKYELIDLWEAVIGPGGGAPVETIGYFSNEGLAKDAADKKASPKAFVECHRVRGVKIGDEYLVGAVKPVEVNPYIAPSMRVDVERRRR